MKRVEENGIKKRHGRKTRKKRNGGKRKKKKKSNEKRNRKKKRKKIGNCWRSGAKMRKRSAVFSCKNSLGRLTTHEKRIFDTSKKEAGKKRED